jgi:peptidoglycan/LPS O-acetylase OafA/YrhL
MAGVSNRMEIGALTGIRFFAALSVVLFHFSQPIARIVHVPFGSFYLNGGETVEFFFMLSGFILTYVHPDLCATDRERTQRFYLARFSKIYPTYLLGWILFAPVIWLNLSALHAGAAALYTRLAVYGLASLFLVQAWTPMTAEVWNIPGWSLSAEAFFYALFPFICVPIKRLTPRAALAVFAIAWAISVLPSALLLAISGTNSQSGAAHAIVNYVPLWRLAEFIAGICLAHVFLRSEGGKSIKFDLVSMLALGLVATVVVCGTHLLAKIIVFPAFVVLIYSLARADGPLSHFLSSRLMKLLGEASFAMYIIHVPVFKLAERFYPALKTTPFALAFYLLGLTVLSIGVLRIIEKPACSYLRKARGVASKQTVPAV